MADEAVTNEAQEKKFEIQRVYLQDASFESPQVPLIFSKEMKPQHNIEINSSNNKIGDDVFDVMMNITVTVKSEDKVAYLVEIKYGGIFTIIGYEPNEIAHILGAQCPGIIYPFARETICDLTVKGGFPQIHLAPINFDALYSHHVQAQAKASVEKDDAVKH